MDEEEDSEEAVIVSRDGLLPLVGETRASGIVKELERLGWGRMFSERHPTPYPMEPWGFDNGAFSAWLNHLPFPTDRFLWRLEHAVGRGIPYLAVVPDLVARGLESLEFSLGWLDRLPAEWPWYLAVQDGMKPADVAPVISLFTGLFLGGTTRFKATAVEWSEFARRYDKRFHYGRASTPERVRQAREARANSLDTAFPLWTSERWREFVNAVLFGPRQGQLA